MVVIFKFIYFLFHILKNQWIRSRSGNDIIYLQVKNSVFIRWDFLKIYSASENKLKIYANIKKVKHKKYGIFKKKILFCNNMSCIKNIFKHFYIFWKYECLMLEKNHPVTWVYENYTSRFLLISYLVCMYS